MEAASTPPLTALKHKHLLGIADLSPEDRAIVIARRILAGGGTVDEITRFLDAFALPQYARDRLVRQIREALTVGGGVRTVDDIRKLLACGADKVSINTAAVVRRSLFWARSLASGEAVSAEDLVALRPASGLAPRHLDRLVGGRTTHAVTAGQPVADQDVAADRGRS